MGSNFWAAGGMNHRKICIELTVFSERRDGKSIILAINWEKTLPIQVHHTHNNGPFVASAWLIGLSEPTHLRSKKEERRMEARFSKPLFAARAANTKVLGGRGGDSLARRQKSQFANWAV